MKFPLFPAAMEHEVKCKVGMNDPVQSADLSSFESWENKLEMIENLKVKLASKAL